MVHLPWFRVYRVKLVNQLDFLSFFSTRPNLGIWTVLKRWAMSICTVCWFYRIMYLVCLMVRFPSSVSMLEMVMDFICRTIRSCWKIIGHLSYVQLVLESCSLILISIGLKITCITTTYTNRAVYKKSCCPYLRYKLVHSFIFTHGIFLLLTKCVKLS